MEAGWIPADYRVWWGYEDEKLFSFAKEELLNLSQSGEPFNLTMLTVDTHFEDGWVCELCQNQFEDDQYANVMACSSHQISEFIQWIRQQDFYENTTIVITGIIRRWTAISVRTCRKIMCGKCIRCISIRRRRQQIRL
uniref:sulfatase-like hydrolase/transferase n=1 Tax=Mediterraneibacter glycyrrhizinilyticus TaxID=342942 RepID=UPI001FA785D8